MKLLSGIFYRILSICGSFYYMKLDHCYFGSLLVKYLKLHSVVQATSFSKWLKLFPDSYYILSSRHSMTCNTFDLPSRTNTPKHSSIFDDKAFIYVFEVYFMTNKFLFKLWWQSFNFTFGKFNFTIQILLLKFYCWILIVLPNLCPNFVWNQIWADAKSNPSYFLVPTYLGLPR